MTRAATRPKMTERERFVFFVARAVKRYYRVPVTDSDDIRTGLVAALYLAEHDSTAKKLTVPE